MDSSYDWFSLGLFSLCACGLDKFPLLSCLTPIGWVPVNGVGEVAVLTSSSVISKSLSDSMVSLLSSINSMTTIFPKLS